MRPIPKKNRLTLLISLLLIVGFLATTLASYFVSAAMFQKEITGSVLPLTSDNIYTEIQKDLIRPIFISSMMASDTFLRDWVLAGEQGVAQMTKYLQEVREKYAAVTSFFVSDKTSIYYHPDGVLKRVDPNEPRDAWYYRVRTMEHPYEINVDMDMANQDTMTIFINYRVYDYAGNYIGATGCGLTVTDVIHLLNRYGQRYDRDIYFVDAQGNLTLTGRNFGRTGNIREIEGLRELASEIFNQGSGSFAYQRNDQTYVLNTRFISELGWYLFVEQTVETHTQGLRHILFVNLAICVVISLAILLAVHATISLYQRRLEIMATTDKLTGLINRHAGEALFHQGMKEARRGDGTLSIILMDIDHFKQINDRCGHQVGDRVLVHVARTTQSCIREIDILSRWGGEEFLMVLKNCPLTDAVTVAEKIRIAIAAMDIEHNGERLSVQVSLGVAQLLDGEDRDHLLVRADRALYTAKSKGRNRTEKSLGLETE